MKLGWPIKVDGSKGPRTTLAVSDFQRGFGFWRRASQVNGYFDKRTRLRILYSIARGGKVSPNFRWSEFQSKGNGWIRANRGFVKALEVYRKKAGPTFLLSTYRDPEHNKNVGGVPNSQHTDVEYNGQTFKGGNAADFAIKKLTLPQVRALEVFSGIGVSADGLVRHVDCRHLGANITNGSPTFPTVWTYPNGHIRG